MVNIEATTPQLKVFQKWIDAFSSLDITEIDPILSKNYIYETFPKSIGLPDETKEEFIKRYKGTLTLFTKIETTTICETAFGPINNDNLTVQSFVEEDGELKILRSKEFSDSAQYNSFYSAKAALEKAATS